MIKKDALKNLICFFDWPSLRIHPQKYVLPRKHRFDLSIDLILFTHTTRPAGTIAIRARMASTYTETMQFDDTLVAQQVARWAIQRTVSWLVFQKQLPCLPAKRAEVVSWLVLPCPRRKWNVLCSAYRWFGESVALCPWSNNRKSCGWSWSAHGSGWTQSIGTCCRAHRDSNESDGGPRWGLASRRK